MKCYIFSLTLETLPEDMQREIFAYAFKCKRKQNFYINKELYTIILPSMVKCKKRRYLDENMCVNCDSRAVIWFRHMSCRLL